MKSSQSRLLTQSFQMGGVFCMTIAIIVLGKPILAPLALAFLIAFVLSPVVQWLERRGVGRILSVTILVSIFVGFSFILLTGLFAQLHDLAAELPSHREEIQEKLKSFRSSSNSTINRVWEMVDETINKANLGVQPPAADDASKVVVLSQSSSMPWLSTIPNVIGPITQPIVTAALVIVLAIFMLMSREDLRNRFIAAFGQNNLISLTRILDDTSKRLGSYLLGLVSVNFGFSVCFALALWVIGVPYAVVWGSVSFVFRFVPLLGSFVSMLLPLVVSVAVIPGWIAPIAVVLSYLTLEGVTGNLIEPWLFGKSVGINPFALLVAIMVWTWAWGPLGLMLATPLSLVIVTLGRHLPCFRSLDYLLGDTQPLPTHITYFQRLIADDTTEAESLLQKSAETKGLAFSVDEVLFPAMTYAKREMRNGGISSEVGRRIFQRNESILWVVAQKNLKASGIQNETNLESNSEVEILEEDSRNLQVLCISVGTERSQIAINTIEAVNQGISWTRSRDLDKSVIDEVVSKKIQVVFLSVSPPLQILRLERFAEMLRSSGYTGWLAVGYWQTKTITRESRRRLKQSGVDYVSNRVHAISRILEFAKDEIQNSNDEVQHGSPQGKLDPVNFVTSPISV